MSDLLIYKDEKGSYQAFDPNEYIDPNPKCYIHEVECYDCNCTTKYNHEDIDTYEDARIGLIHYIKCSECGLTNQINW